MVYITSCKWWFHWNPKSSILQTVFNRGTEIGWQKSKHMSGLMRHSFSRLIRITREEYLHRCGESKNAGFTDIPLLTCVPLRVNGSFTALEIRWSEWICAWGSFGYVYLHRHAGMGLPTFIRVSLPREVGGQYFSSVICIFLPASESGECISVVTSKKGMGSVA